MAKKGKLPRRAELRDVDGLDVLILRGLPVWIGDKWTEYVFDIKGNKGVKREYLIGATGGVVLCGAYVRPEGDGKYEYRVGSIKRGGFLAQEDAIKVCEHYVMHAGGAV